MKILSIVNSYYKGAKYPEFPWNIRQHSRIEDSSTRREEASSENKQGDRGDLAEGS